MKRKIGGIVLAMVLATIGTVALVAYVNKAKDDAIEDSAQVKVLVVTNRIPQGATLAAIEAAIEETDVPQRLVAEGALSSVEGIDTSLVAGITMQPGDQLLRSRLVDPATLVRVDVPEGLQELTIALSPERVVGGVVQPGETVGMVLSFDPFQSNAAGVPETTLPADGTEVTVPAQPTQTPNTTHLVLNQVLVTAVQFSVQDSERRTQTTDDDGADSTAITVSEAPSSVLLVTVAVTTSQAEQIVFAAEFGHIWLTRQNADTDTTGGRILTLDQVYVTVPV